MAERRGRIAPAKARAFLESLAGFNIEIAAAPALADLQRLYAVASANRLTAYDAAYLDLAKRRGLALATLDADLRKAAIAEGITVL